MISDQIKNYVLEGIYNGYITLNKLPDNLYLATAKNLMSSVNKGFKTKPLTNDINKKYVGDKQMKQSFEENVYRFSAAKTFQEVYEIQQKVFDEEGFKIGFSEFKEQAESIWNDFNEDWLKTEINTAFSQAQSAEQWQEFEAQKETLPYLTFKTVEDDRVREDHQLLDNICLPVDDPFWDENMPPLEWNCRCFVISGDEDNTTSESEVKEKLDKIDINEDFRFNPGKEQIVFADTHPYFDVPEKYQDFKDNNFNLPLPSDKKEDRSEPITDSIHTNILHLIEFPELRQLYNYDCGASSLQAVLIYYGYERREDELLKKLKAKGTDIFDNGVKVSDIVRVASEEEKVKTEVLRGLEPKDLIPYIKEDHPIIVLLQAWRDSKSPKEWDNDYKDGHYVVAIGYEKDKIIFEDPSSYVRTFLSFSELKKRWHAINDNNEKDPVSLCIVFSGQKKFKKNEVIHMG